MKPMKKKLLALLLYLSLVAVAIENYAVARTDLDWMVVSYRYNEWHRSQETWEFSPHLKMNWWNAYMLTVWRLIIACLMLAALTVVLGIVIFKCFTLTDLSPFF